MPITGFRSNVRPAEGSIVAAYRPIVFQPQINFGVAIPPVVYCDVYLNNVLYKTLTSTSHLQTSIMSAAYWIFDIQNVTQEYLRSNLPILTTTNIAPTVNDLVGTLSSSVSCYCKFRGSSIDTNGFTIPESITIAYVSPTFNVINSVLQHEDVQDLGTYLTALKHTPFDNYHINFLPLTQRPNKYLVGRDDYDHYPVFTKEGSPPLIIGTHYYLLRLVYKADGITTTVNTTLQYSFPVINIAYTFPSSIKLLRELVWNTLVYPVFTPVAVPWEKITEYYLQICGSVYPPGPPFIRVHFTSPTFIPVNSKHKMRIRFLNYLGFWDAVNFCEINGTMIVTSEQWQKALKFPLNKSDGGSRRLNVRSNEKFTISTCDYGEEFQEWLKQLFDTTEAYLEWSGPQTNGQAPANIPITIVNGEYSFKKVNDRYDYVTEITFMMSNENIRQRN